MSGLSPVIDGLDGVLESGSPQQRAHLTMRLADLFTDGTVHYSDAQIAVFDDVFQRLLAALEHGAKVELARRLSSTEMMPPATARVLALDASADVAAPLLTDGQSLDEAVLVQCARTRSQDHLLAIAKRAVVSEPVTDVLVVRGERPVVREIAVNPGSRFSNAGYGILVNRTEDDDELVTLVGSRPDLPRHHFLRLLSTASDQVKEKLLQARQDPADSIRAAVALVADRIATRTVVESKDYAAAATLAEALHRAGRLGEKQVLAAAVGGHFEHTVAAVARLGDLPLTMVERAMIQTRPEALLLILKAIGMTWPTVRAVLQMRHGPAGTTALALEQALASFERIKRATAEQVVAFQRARVE